MRWRFFSISPLASYADYPVLRKMNVKIYYSSPSYQDHIINFDNCPTDVEVDVLDLGNGIEFGQKVNTCTIMIDSKPITLQYNLKMNRFPEPFAEDNIKVPAGYFYQSSFTFEKSTDYNFGKTGHYSTYSLVPLNSSRILFFPYNILLCDENTNDCINLWFSTQFEDQD